MSDLEKKPQSNEANVPSLRNEVLQASSATVNTQAAFIPQPVPANLTPQSFLEPEKLNGKQATKRLSKIEKKQLELRRQLWGDISTEDLWDRRTQTGFTTIPRAMSIIMRIMDDLADNGKPVSITYFSLWCRVFDTSFIEIKSPDDLSFESGFSGQRAVSVWKQRMKKLAELGFINAKQKGSSEYGYVLIYNPYKVIKKHYEEGRVQEAKFTSLFARALDIGADDLK